MRILLVIDHLDSGGAQHQMVTLSRGLAARGHELSCFVYYGHMDHHRETLVNLGVDIHAIQKRSRFSLKVPVELARLMRQGSFDVSLSYLTTPNVYNALCGASSGVPTIVSERSALRPEHGVRRKWRYEMYRLADRVLVNSAHHYSDLGSAFPWMSPKLAMIRNGVDLERFRPGPDPRKRIDGQLNLVAVGSIHEGKNYLGLIEALRLHRDKHGWAPNIRWIGRAATSASDVSAFEEAEDLLDRTGLRENWSWMGVRRDIPDQLASADALIHPSFFEGLPNVICEALASGVPVLAGRVCDHPWLVGEGERGLLFDPANPSDIETAIHRYSRLSDHEVHSMRRKAREFAETELSLDRLTTRYEELFAEVVRQS